MPADEDMPGEDDGIEVGAEMRTALATPESEEVAPPVEEPDATGDVLIEQPTFGIDKDAPPAPDETPPAAPAAEVPAPEAAPPPEAEPFDERLIDTALRHGYTADDIDKLGDSANMVLEKLAAEDVSQQQTPYAPAPGGREGGQQFQPAGQVEGTYRPFEFVLPDELAEDLPPKWREAVGEPIAQRFSQNEGVLGRIAGRLAELESQLAARELDGFVDGLGDDFQHMYGKGAIAELPYGSPAHQARQQLHQEAGVVMDLWRQRGRPISRSAALAQVHALRAQGGGAAAERQKIREKLSGKLRDAKGQFISRPQSRGASGPRVERSFAAAVGAVEQFQAGGSGD